MRLQKPCDGGMSRGPQTRLILSLFFLASHISEYSRAPDNEGPVVPWCPDRVLSSPTPLPADWNSYLESVSAPAFEITFLRTMAKHQLSLPLTILSALQRFGLLSQFLDLNNPRSLTVHVLGATPNYDLMTGWLAYEEILHFCPGVSELRLVLVGPNISSSESKQEDSVEVCETCKTRKRSKVYECHRSVAFLFFPSLLFNRYMANSKPFCSTVASTTSIAAASQRPHRFPTSPSPSTRASSTPHLTGRQLFGTSSTLASPRCSRATIPARPRRILRS